MTSDRVPEFPSPLRPVTSGALATPRRLPYSRIAVPLILTEEPSPMRTFPQRLLLSELCALSLPQWADEVSVSAQVKDTDKKESAEQAAAAKPREVATEGTVTIEGKSVAYKAIA